jgi:hypothetical protein
MKRKRLLLKKSLIKLPSLLNAHQLKSGDRIVEMSKLFHQNEDKKNQSAISFLGLQIQEKTQKDSIIFPKKFQDKLNESNNPQSNKSKFKIKPINRTWRDLTEDKKFLNYDSKKENKFVLDKSK